MGRRKRGEELSEYSLKQMRALYLMGYTQEAIAKWFKPPLDRSTVSYYCSDIKRPFKIIKRKYVADSPEPSPFSELNKVKLQQYIAQYANNQGKTYADYLRQEKEQKLRERKVGQERLCLVKLNDQERKQKPYINI